MIKFSKTELLFCAISLVGYILIGWILPRENFLFQLIIYSILFLSYILFTLKTKLNFRNIIVIALIFRVLFIASTPKLSDDYFRFIWDANRVEEGVSPYAKLPSSTFLTSSLDKELLNKMNSPNYYSVYPPLQQLFFLPSSFGNNIPVALLILHFVVFIGELLLFYFLIKIYKEKIISLAQLSLILLNPLWIIEVNGNLHFEGWMLTFVAAGIYFLQKNISLFSSLFFSLAVGVKLIPILILPLIKKWKGVKSSIVITLISFVLFLIPFIYFIHPYQDNFFTSIDLYYHKFEFNASFYFLLREIGFLLGNTHPIVYSSYILMPLFILLALLLYFKKDKFTQQDFFLSATIILTSYLLLSTTVHPWYILPVLFFSVLSGKLFGIIWSGLVFLSYAAYSGSETLYYGMITMEYLILFLLIYLEYKNKLRFSQPT